MTFVKNVVLSEVSSAETKIGEETIAARTLQPSQDQAGIRPSPILKRLEDE